MQVADMVRFARVCWLLSAVLLAGCAAGRPPVSLSEAEGYDRWSTRDWMDPQRPSRPMIRWWWPGGHVTDQGVAAELALLDDLGFGGIEIQPFAFGLLEDEAPAGAVRTVGSASFLAKLDYALAEARRRGMRVDLTMSSGWGVGGPLDCTECATHQLLMTELDMTGPADIDVIVPLPTSAPYDGNRVARELGLAGTFDPDLQLVAVVRGRLQGSGPGPADRPAIVEELIDVTGDVREGRLQTRLATGRFRLFAVFRNLTNTRLAGAAYPGNPTEFRTIDHLDKRGLDAFQRSYFDGLTKALSTPPDHYFVDSFEFLADLPWTPSFRQAFTQARGYDLLPYLPLLFLGAGEYSFVGRTQQRAVMGEVGERVREDYVDVRAEMFETGFIEPLREAVHASGAKLRLQALGGYGDYLDVFGAVDVPEAEDFGLDGHSEFVRLASSAAHVAGRRLASNEAFVGFGDASTALTEDDYQLMAGRAFAVGINQLVFHGRAYPTTIEPSARWYPFEAFNITTRLDETNPLWPRLRHLTTTIGRLTYAMTRGRPATQVAWLLSELRPPEFDPIIRPGSPAASLDEGPYLEASPISRVLRQHAIGFDRVSRGSLARSARICEGRVCIGEARYDMVLVDHATVASVDWLDRLRDLAAGGVPVVFVGPEASRARGFADAVARDEAMRGVMAQLAQLSSYHVVPTAADLGPILRTLTESRAIRPAEPDTWSFATAERTLPAENILFILNGTASDDVAVFEVLRSCEGVILDPEDGFMAHRFSVGRDERLRIVVPGRRSRIVRLMCAS